MKQPVFLRIFLNDELIEVKQSTEPQVVVGSGESATIVLPNDEVSGIHCMIEERDEGYFVSDLGSEAGTILNGTKVLDTKIESGNEILVGPYRIEFFIGVPKPLKAPVASKPAKKDKAPKVVVPPSADNKKTEKVVPMDKGTAKVKKAEVPKEIPEIAEEPAEEEEAIDFKVSAPIERPASASEPLRFDTSRNEYSKQTFSPKSKHQDLSDIISPSEGNQVEVIVAWQERVIGTYAFKKGKSVTVGSSGANIFVPSMDSKSAFELITYKENIVVHVPSGVFGTFVTEKSSKDLDKILAVKPGQRDITLNQGEMVVLRFDQGNIQVVIRYTKSSKKPIAAPLIDLTPSELVSFIMAGVIGFMFSVYMFVYSPELDEEAKIEDKVRFAKVALNAPKIIKPLPVKVTEAKASAPTQKKKADTAKTKNKQGKTGQVARSKKKSNTKKNKVGVTRAGGSKKTSKRGGGSVKSKRPDPTKSGLLGALGGGGIMDSIDQATSGSGELTGLANESTGASGFSEDRAGEGIGLKGTTASGKGASAVGVGNVGTRGRGTGVLGTGTGGLGEKSNTNISLDGEEAFFEGTVDREAVRRVILQNKRSIKYCYERSLRGNSTVAGKLTIYWKVVERGRVQVVRTVSNDTGNKKLARCVMNKIKGLRFPEPPEDQEYEVNYPFFFNSR